MTLLQRLWHWLFGTEYVNLIHHDGAYSLRRAYKLGDHWFSHPHLRDTRCKLLPDGTTKGKSYIHGWEQVTGGVPMTDVNSRSTNDE